VRTADTGRWLVRALALVAIGFGAHTALAVPTFTTTPITSVSVGATYNYEVATVDSQGGNRTLTATALPSWLQLNATGVGNGSARLQGTPTQANIGTHNVSLVVTNAATNATATQSFTITVVGGNAPPTFTSTPVTSATAGSAYVYNVTTADVNPGDTRTVSAPALPAWLRLEAVDPSSGTARLTGTPRPTDGGPHSVTLVVTDGGRLTAAQSFALTVTVLNAAPTFSSSPVTTATQGQSYTYNIATSDSDADQTRTITATLLPSWLTLTGVDATRGTATLSGTPGPAQLGQHPVALLVTDNGTPSAFGAQSFTVTVEPPPNVPPRPVGSIPTQTTTENSPFQLLDANGRPTTLGAFFEDPNGDALTYQVTGLPTGGRLAVNPANGGIVGTPLAADARDTPYLVTVTASDGQSVSEPQTFGLTIALLDRADLSLTAAMTPQPATVNTSVEWRLTIANAGPQAAGASNLWLAFAGNPVTFPQLGPCAVTPVGGTPILACTVPPVEAGGTTEIVLRGSAVQAGDVLLGAEVRLAAPVPIDPNLDNNRASAAANIAQTLSDGPAQSLSSANNTGAAAGDVNGDGFLDLVLAKSTGGAAEIYLNVVNPANPAQRRLSETPITLGDATPSSDVALADFDADGDLDIVTTNLTGLSNNVFMNGGAAAFTLWATVGSGNSRAVAVGDFSGDNRVDLAFANNGANQVYLNDGSTRFTLSDTIDNGDNRDVVAADFDLDGRIDLVFANATGPSRFVRNLGGGQFADGVVIDNGGSQAVAAGDFNGDNRSDLVLARAASGAPSVVVYENSSTGSFVSRSGVGGALIADVLTTDVDLDGKTDVIAISSTGTHQIYRGDGAMGFALHPVQFTSASPDGAVPGKFGVDDRVDLAVGGAGSAAIFFNDGGGGLGLGDTQPPSIALNGDATVTLTVEAAYQDPGATATDALDGDLTPKIVVSNPVNTALVGTFTVTYDVTDSSGNAAPRQTRTVRVVARENQGGGGGGAVDPFFVLFLFLLYLVAGRAVFVPPDRPYGVTRARLNWARRLKRVFGIEIEQCVRCGGRLKVIASIEEPEPIERIVVHRRERERRRRRRLGGGARTAVGVIVVIPIVTGSCPLARAAGGAARGELTRGGRGARALIARGAARLRADSVSSSAGGFEDMLVTRRYCRRRRAVENSYPPRTSS
jgi:hypothetical protein